MNANKIRVLVVEPGKPPRKEEISGGLAAMQRIIGNGITEELCPFVERVSIIRSGDGGGLPPNYLLKNGNGEPVEVIRGTFVVTRTERGRYVSLTDEQIPRYMEEFSRNRLSCVSVRIVPLPPDVAGCRDVQSVSIVLPAIPKARDRELAGAVFRMLTELEDLADFDRAVCVGGLCVCMMPECSAALDRMLDEWQEQAVRLEMGEITKADYDRWRRWFSLI